MTALCHAFRFVPTTHRPIHRHTYSPTHRLANSLELPVLPAPNALAAPAKPPTPWRMACVLLVALLLSLLVACGGGGGGDSTTPPAPSVSPAAPVTLLGAASATIAPTGGTISAPLQENGGVQLQYPAGAVKAATPVTLTTAAPQGGEWLRFSLTPGIGSLRAPVTLTVTPPTSLSAASLPVLRLDTPTGPIQLRTQRLADGRLQAVLPAPRRLTAAATKGTPSAQPDVAQAMGQLSPQAVDPLDPNAPTFIGSIVFASICRLPTDVLVEANAMLLAADTADQIMHTIGMLSVMKDNCGQADTQQRLIEFGQRATVEYANAFAQWQALDYVNLKANRAYFRPWLTRALSWCSVALLLGSTPDCQNLPLLEVEFAELVTGFVLGTDDPTVEKADLRKLAKQLIEIAEDAALLDLTEIFNVFQELIGEVFDKLSEKAYVGCHANDMYQMWLNVAVSGLGTIPESVLLDNLAYCGFQIDIAASRTQPDGTTASISDNSLLPGTFRGVRPDVQKAVTVPYDATLKFSIPRFTAYNLSCKSSFGTNFAYTETVVMKVGSVELGTFAPVGSGGNYDTVPVNIDIPRLIAVLGRPADSKDPIAIEMHRINASVDGCIGDDGVTPFAMVLPDKLLYTLTIKPPVQALAGTLTLEHQLNTNFDVKGFPVYASKGTGGGSMRVVYNIEYAKGQWAATIVSRTGEAAYSSWSESTWYQYGYRSTASRTIGCGFSYTGSTFPVTIGPSGQPIITATTISELWSMVGVSVTNFNELGPATVPPPITTAYCGTDRANWQSSLSIGWGSHINDPDIDLSTLSGVKEVVYAESMPNGYTGTYAIIHKFNLSWNFSQP